MDPNVHTLKVLQLVSHIKNDKNPVAVRVVVQHETNRSPILLCSKIDLKQGMIAMTGEINIDVSLFPSFTFVVTIEKYGALSASVLRTLQSALYSAQACIQQQQQHPDGVLEFQLQEGHQTNPAMVLQATLRPYNPFAAEEAALDALPVGGYGVATFCSKVGHSTAYEDKFKEGTGKATKQVADFCNRNAHRIR